MSGYSIESIAGYTGGKLITGPSNRVVDHLLIDSRKLVFPAQSIFFALKGGRRDGHLFVKDLYARGVRCFMVSEPACIGDLPYASVIGVPDTLVALQKLAAFHRSRFQYPVIGITGSNGKTIVKEWLHHLLEKDYRIVRSPRSYNSQVGVPLSVWQMGPNDQLGIFEAGISRRGEMERLEPMIRPDLGILTNIGEAHNEGFRDKQEKLTEKLKLFTHCSQLIFCADHELTARYFDQHREAYSGKLFSWGRSPVADLRILSVETGRNSTSITAVCRNNSHSILIPFTGQAAVENAMHAWSVMLCLDRPFERMAERMADLPVLAMRMELKQGINGCSVINDSYNADRSSLQIALDFLSQQSQHDKRTLILSDIFQAGVREEKLYGDIAEVIWQKKIDRLIGIGPSISLHQHLFERKNLESAFYPATDIFLSQLHPSQFRDEAILVKGSRAFEFERICHALELKVHQTVLEINLSAVAGNLRAYQRMLKPEVRMMVMVKAFSYGAGSYEIASLLQFHKADYLSVAYADEGVELRKAGIMLPVVVMNTEDSSFRALTDYDLQPVLFSFGVLRAFNQFLKSEGISEYPVHIKLDTGMHRLGFDPGEVTALTEWLSSAGTMRVQSVFSHLAASEDPAEDAFTAEQAGIFTTCCDLLEKGLTYGFLRHIANTAAIRRHPHLQMDMVRLGIGLYGVDPGPDSELSLQEVSTLKTTVAQVRKVSEGQTVGYNRKGVMLRDSLIATIRIGYADGFPRSMGNGAGMVWIRGALYPVIGNVCMDMTMVDITGSEDIEAGEEVIIFGRPLSVKQMARWAGTIPYEILTGISQRVIRVYFEE